MTLWHQQILISSERKSSFSSKSFHFEYHYDLNWIKWFFSFVTNVMSLTMMITLQIFMNHKLLSRVRSAVKDVVNSTSKLSINIKVLEKQSLMLSMYIETFWFFVQVFVTRCSSHTVVHINNWLLSRNKISMMSSHSAHMNAEVWNIKDDAHLLDKFWIERFLIDSNDSESGSTRMNVTDHRSNDNKKLIYSVNEVRFSLKDLKGSWIPYEDESSSCSLHVHTTDDFAGEHSICSKKHFVKRKILLTCAMMIFMFDIEILANDKALELNSSTYDLSLQKSKKKIAFRIRKRELDFNAKEFDWSYINDISFYIMIVVKHDERGMKKWHIWYISREDQENTIKIVRSYAIYYYANRDNHRQTRWNYI